MNRTQYSAFARVHSGALPGFGQHHLDQRRVEQRLRRRDPDGLPEGRKLPVSFREGSELAHVRMSRIDDTLKGMVARSRARADLRGRDHRHSAPPALINQMAETIQKIGLARSSSRSQRMSKANQAMVQKYRTTSSRKSKPTWKRALGQDVHAVWRCARLLPARLGLGASAQEIFMMIRRQARPSAESELHGCAPAATTASCAARASCRSRISCHGLANYAHRSALRPSRIRPPFREDVLEEHLHDRRVNELKLSAGRYFMDGNR